MVDGRRRRPGEGAPGLLHDAPPDLSEAPYSDCWQALSEVSRLFTHGLDARGWDWATGFPLGWPTSLRDRARARFAWHAS